MSDFRLTILGSSGALPAYGRFTTAQHLALHHHQLLIDCGEGCQHQLRRYELSQQKINHIFISHLHGDHYLGLMGLIFSMHLLRRESDLHIYSLRGLDEIILTHLRHSRSSLNFKLVLHPLTDEGSEQILDDDHLTVTSFPMDHKIPTVGFLFREKPRQRPLDKSKLAGVPVEYLNRLKKGEDILDEQGNVIYASEAHTFPSPPARSYAYCSDTRPSNKVIEVVKQVDLLYHEATFMNDELGKAMETRHSTASEAGMVAREAQAKKLLIGHFSARYKDLLPLLNEARTVFPETQLAEEGQKFDITAA